MTDVANNTETPPNALALWTGILAGPFAWFMQMQINYALVPWACATGHMMVLHMVMFGGLLIVAASMLAAWREWRRLGREWPKGAGGPQMRSRFMAVLGLFTSLLFFFVILAQGIPSFILSPCQP
jgi:hypothetical protein